jgi:LysR family transcriptional regulator, transcriptional activator of nhaA
MDWLNYHHLLYFWVVAREGSIVRASAHLRLAQSTISSQIQALEKALGAQLFTREGRHLLLTETGRVVYQYADAIFPLGRDLLRTLKAQPTTHPLRVMVGVTDVLPKALVARLLTPALQLATPMRFVCYEWEFEHLLAELALRHLDVVLSDTPMSPVIKIRAFSHLLGACGMSFCGTAALAATYRPGFPTSLHGAPMLLPTSNTSLRLALDRWFATQEIRPVIVGECEDSALLQAFAQEGLGLFPVPTILEAEVRQQLGVDILGRVKAVRQRFYAITTEREVKHPAIVAMVRHARQVFAP